jgi:hypothetical protein
MKLDFKTKLGNREISLFGLMHHIPALGGLDFDFEASADIFYSSEIDIRSWGIAGITVDVSKVKLSLDITLDKEFLSLEEIDGLVAFGFISSGSELAYYGYELEFTSGFKVDYCVYSGPCVSLNDLEITFERDGSFKLNVQ